MDPYIIAPAEDLGHLGADLHEVLSDDETDHHQQRHGEYPHTYKVHTAMIDGDVWTKSMNTDM